MNGNISILFETIKDASKTKKSINFIEIYAGETDILGATGIPHSLSMDEENNFSFMIKEDTFSVDATDKILFYKDNLKTYFSIIAENSDTVLVIILDTESEVKSCVDECFVML